MKPIPITITEALRQGIEFHRAGNLQEAERLYRLILEVQPNHTDAHHNLGVLALQVGKPEAALPFLQAALEGNPSNGQYWISFIEGLIKTGQQNKARQLLDQGKSKGLSGLAVENLEEQLSKPIQNEAASPSETEREKFGIPPTATPLPRKEMDQIIFYFNEGRYIEAEAYARQLIERYPASPFAWKALGTILAKSQKNKESIPILEKAISLSQNDPEIYNNLGNALNDIGKMDEALRCYTQAIKIRPDYAEAYNNRGNIFARLDMTNQALEQYFIAIKLKSDYCEAYNNTGIILKNIGKFEESIKYCRNALKINKNYTDAHSTLADALLASGKYTEGWHELEYRWDAQYFADTRRHYKKPRWKGEMTPGKTIFIYAHQGFGDTLQFCRYAALVARAGLQVVMEVQKPIFRLLNSLNGVNTLIPQDQEPPDFDFHAPLLSLPGIFDTKLETIPSQASYLRAEETDVKDWTERLPKDAPSTLRVGLVWAGTARNAIDKRRSIRPELLAPLLDLSGIRYISLQKDGPNAPAGYPLLNIVEHIHDFADSAALIMNLDLVISVDTAVAHLAGALGKPIWMLNRFDSCWRWQRNSEYTAWYPSMRIFHQKRWGDWEEVIARVRKELSTLKDRLRTA